MSAEIRSVTGNAHHVRPCGVVQPTRLPLMQEITGAKPVKDAKFHAPQSILSDALLWYGSQFGAIPGGGSKFRTTAVEPAFRQAS